MSKIFKKVPIEVQNRSGFDCSHSNTFTAKVAALTPCLVDHIPPNTDLSLDVSCEVNLPPAISDFYGQIEARLEFFFVPYRVIWAGWKYFFVQPPLGGNNMIPSNKPTAIQIKDVPGAQILPNNTFAERGSLADMLGWKGKTTVNTQNSGIPNILPFVAYQKIYDDFYRDSRITQPIFTPPTSTSQQSWKNLPWILGDDLTTGNKKWFNMSNDDMSLFDLRQRCWDKDYFTNATTAPQAGASSSLEFDIQTTPIDGAGGPQEGTASFSISALRVANSLQHFAEINGLAGQRMADQQYARFGCYPSDASLDRPIYLGQKRFSVYKRSVYQQTENLTNGNPNPFSGILGNKTSALSGYGEGFMGKFKAKDAGLLFVMFSLVPKPVYSTGTRRYLTYSKLSDFPEPLLQGTGDQPIYDFELVSGAWFDKSKVFGYTQRFAEIKFMQDEVHGLLSDGENLDMFQLQRSFNTEQELSTEFLEIPQNYLDQITTADASISEFGCWCQCGFKYKKVMPFAAYSMPTLEAPKDTHTVLIDNGGKRL